MKHKYCYECGKIGHKPDMIKTRLFYDKLCGQNRAIINKQTIIYIHPECKTKKYNHSNDLTLNIRW